MLKIGTKAPEFNLPNQNGEMISLKDFNGKKLVIYFYPKDNTPGCTKEALSFKEDYEKYLENGYEVIGISKDSVSTHKKFSDKYELPFMLLSDESLETLVNYEVWAEKKMCGKRYMGILRQTYVINEDGIIINTYEKVKPETSSSDIICSLKN